MRYFHSTAPNYGGFSFPCQGKKMNETLLSYGLAVVVGVIGWFVRVLWDADKEMRESLSRLREDLPREFVQKEDYRRDIYDIKAMLKDISDKLDGKADK